MDELIESITLEKNSPPRKRDMKKNLWKFFIRSNAPPSIVIIIRCHLLINLFLMNGALRISYFWRKFFPAHMHDIEWEKIGFFPPARKKLAEIQSSMSLKSSVGVVSIKRHIVFSNKNFFVFMGSSIHYLWPHFKGGWYFFHNFWQTPPRPPHPSFLTLQLITRHF